MYDASIARWNGVDALAEKYGSYTPYAYVANNPVIFIDPDGRTIFDANGNEVIVEKNKGTKSFTFSTSNGDDLDEGTQQILNSLNGNKDGRKLIRNLDKNTKERKLVLSGKSGLIKQGDGIAVTRGTTAFDDEGNATIYVHEGAFENRRPSEESLTEDYYDVIDGSDNGGRELNTTRMSKSEILDLYNNPTQAGQVKSGAIRSLSSDERETYRQSEQYKYSSINKFIELVSYHEGTHTLSSNIVSRNPELNAVKAEIKYFNRNHQN